MVSGASRDPLQGSDVAIIYNRISPRDGPHRMAHLPICPVPTDLASHPTCTVRKPTSAELYRLSLAGVVPTSYNPALRQIILLCRECSCATSSSLACRCAPDSRSSTTWSDKPALAAKKSGVWPALFRRCTDAPCKRSIRKASMLGPIAARCCRFC